MGSATEARERLPYHKLLLTFVGMPGAGKTEATLYLEKKNIPFIRFGQITDEGVKEMGLPLTPDNERVFREKLRADLGMAAYAIKAKPKIGELLKENNTLVIDGLYSWEEYVLLKKEFSSLTLIHVFAEAKIRYKRLSERQIRPVPIEKCYQRDVLEIENLNKGGPIAIADYLIENNQDDINQFYSKIDMLLSRFGI